MCAVCIDPAFVTHEEDGDSPSKRKYWRIYKSSNIEGSQSSGVHNPRDGTLDSSDTEQLVCMKFTDMKEAIPQILSHWKKE